MSTTKHGANEQMPRRSRSVRGCVAARALLVVVLAALPAGCASVAPYEKEHLADPILALDAETGEEAREVKWLEAREGSTGGVGGAGGGCACN